MTKLLAYGSLMWDNALAAVPGTAVRVDGFRRAFVGENTTRWGTPERPCPQIGLVAGAGCEAVLFDLPRDRSRRILHNLKRREGTRARSVRVRNGNGRQIRAKSFIQPAGSQLWEDSEELIRALRAAKGYVGTGTEYVRAIIHAMGLWKIEDPLLQDVWEEIKP